MAKKHTDTASERRKLEALRAKKQALDMIYDDLPDGAYFAIMEENGIDTDDMIAIQEYENTL